MPKILINQRICDHAPACGGIEVCPNHALSFDNNQNKVIWDEHLCTFCLKCTLPSACPVGAILYATDEDQEKSIMDSISADPRSQEWLWLERYGVMPGTTPPLATKITPKNFTSIMESSDSKIIDVWHPDYLDCRLHSPLFSDLLKSIDQPISIYKLDAGQYPDLANKLSITQYPSLLAYKAGQQVFLFTGYLTADLTDSTNQELIDIYSNK